MDKTQTVKIKGKEVPLIRVDSSFLCKKPDCNVRIKSSKKYCVNHMGYGRSLNYKRKRRE